VLVEIRTTSVWSGRGRSQYTCCWCVFNELRVERCETDGRIEFELDKLKGRHRIEDVNVDEMIILKWILNMMGGPELP